VDVLAYAAYRMPATHAAMRSALARAAQAVPSLAPASLLDLGGGTGAAAWAATEVFPSLRSVTVLDQVPEALRLGQRLGARRPELRHAHWRTETLPPRSALPGAELVTISYVLGELSPPDQAALLAAATAAAGGGTAGGGTAGGGAAGGAVAGGAVAVVEPGTPAGYGRVLAARAALLAAGWRVAAPCPHQADCPLSDPDWCHFSVRINRSSLHRQVKGAQLGYEDEKFAYVVAVPGTEPDLAPHPPPARVLRHPVTRKGLVALRLCTGAGAIAQDTVSKRQGDRYRAARDLAWGDPWSVP
jgi:ribosomal protein RSM22 (predicted rRNA methylase)